MAVSKILFWLIGLVWLLIPIAHYRIWPEVPIYVAEFPLIGLALVFIGTRYGRKQLAASLKDFGLFYVALAMIVLGAAIPFLRGTAPLGAIGLFKSWIIFPVGFVAALIIARPNREAIRLWLTLWWLGLAAAGSAALLAAGMGYFTYDGRLASGLFTSPNALAMLISPGIVLGLWLQQFYLGQQLWMVRIATVGLAWATLLTQSYSALGALVAIGIGYFFFRQKNKRLSLVLFGGLVCVLLVWMAPTSKFQELVSMGERSSLASRMMIWRSAEAILEDSFPWGIGVGQFQTWYLAYQAQFPPYLEWAVPEPHNVFLALLLSTGAVGSVAFLGLFAWAIHKLVRAIPKSDDHSEFSLPVLLLMLLTWWFLVGLVDTPLFRQSVSLAYFGIIGMALAYTSRETSVPNATTN